MTGLIKMYCYKMFRQKSLYIIWILLCGFVLVSKSMTEDKTLSGLLCETGSFYLLLSSIFPAVFFSSDISCGFIKNYAGSVSGRGVIIGARAVLVIIQNLLTMIILIAANYLYTMKTGDMSFAVRFSVCTFLAGLGCSFLAMLVTELFRKTVPAIIITITIGSGLICNLLGTVSGQITDGKFIANDYLVTGMLDMLSKTHLNDDALKTIVISCIYIIIAYAVSLISIKKRDVV
ncbi:MAG: hypothetical protein IJ740_17335 [Ruminococcus sp.]|nr:hypothetical protein [Ruminococcus sp.]